MLLGIHPGMPKVKVSMVDVREVAAAHVKALSTEAAGNQRFVLAGHTMWCSDLARMIDGEFGGPQGYPVVTKELPYCVTRFAALFISDVAFILPMWGKNFEFNNDKSKSVLSTEYRPANDSVFDMIHSMIDAGWIEDKRKPKEESKE